MRIETVALALMTFTQIIAVLSQKQNNCTLPHGECFNPVGTSLRAAMPTETNTSYLQTVQPILVHVLNKSDPLLFIGIISTQSDKDKFTLIGSSNWLLIIKYFLRASLEQRMADRNKTSRGQQQENYCLKPTSIVFYHQNHHSQMKREYVFFCNKIYCQCSSFPIFGPLEPLHRKC